MTSSNKPGFRNIPPPAGKQTSVYGRFIPREELSGFSAWTPGTLDDPMAPPQHLGVHRAAPPAPQQPPEPTPPQVDPAEELQALLHNTRQQGYQDGYRDGLVALDGFKQTYARQVASQVGSITTALGQQLESLQQDMARALAVAATHLARQMVMDELATRPELVCHVAEQALDSLLLSAHHITLRVHPDDHALVVDGAGEALAARGARVVGDRTVTRGGCLVESDIGVVDASIENRWRRAVASLGSEESWQGGAAAPAPAASPADAPEGGDTP